MKEKIFKVLNDKSLNFALVESCTGGGLSLDFVMLSGASDVYRGGMTPYQDEAKIQMLGVSESLIHQHSSVSSEVALEMAKRGRDFFKADLCLATTGWAGPAGGRGADPVGTVYFAACDKSFEVVERRIFKESNSREQVMGLAKDYAWTFFAKFLEKSDA